MYTGCIRIHKTGVETGATRFEGENTSTPEEHSTVGDAPMTGIRYDLGVFIQCPLRHLERWRLPRFPTSLHLLFCYLHFQSVRHGIDTDDIPILNESNRTADLSLGNDVADDETMGANARRR